MYKFSNTHICFKSVTPSWEIGKSDKIGVRIKPQCVRSVGCVFALLYTLADDLECSWMI